MISVKKAIRLVEHHTNPLEPIEMDLENALNLVLAKDIIAPISLPPFPQSAMDGYAIAYEEGQETVFQLIGEIKAGDASTFSLKTGEAVRIFTGAMVPEGATTVIMQEVTEVKGEKLIIHQEIKNGINIRPKGEQTQKGDLALAKGTILNPAGIGFLNGLGITEVSVYRKPSVGVIVTGNELVQAGEELKPGQIYESNSNTLISALQSTGITDAEKIIVEDNLEATIRSIQQLIKEKDMLILSGGISVGDYDFVGKALKALEVEEIFYKVKQKPGKPLFFGKKNHSLIFALPGNPAAALTCYYQYVLPAIHKMSGRNYCGLTKRKCLLKDQYVKKGDRAQFLKANIQGDYAEVLEGQSSAMLHTFSIADALIYIPEDKNEVEKNEEVICYLLPT